MITLYLQYQQVLCQSVWPPERYYKICLLTSLFPLDLVRRSCQSSQSVQSAVYFISSCLYPSSGQAWCEVSLHQECCLLTESDNGRPGDNLPVLYSLSLTTLSSSVQDLIIFNITTNNSFSHKILLIMLQHSCLRSDHKSIIKTQTQSGLWVRPDPLIAQFKSHRDIRGEV